MKPIREGDGIVSLRSLLAVAALASLVALTSCTADGSTPQHQSSDPAPSEEFFYRETPLALRVEPIPRVAPRPTYEWGGGYWARHNNRWNWMEAPWSPGTQPYSGWEYGQGYYREWGPWR